MVNISESRCGVCGSNLIWIRGRHPEHEKRQVCVQCLAERIDQIREISSPAYGQACQPLEKAKETL